MKITNKLVTAVCLSALLAAGFTGCGNTSPEEETTISAVTATDAQTTVRNETEPTSDEAGTQETETAGETTGETTGEATTGLFELSADETAGTEEGEKTYIYSGIIKLSVSADCDVTNSGNTMRIENRQTGAVLVLSPHEDGQTVEEIISALTADENNTGVGIPRDEKSGSLDSKVFSVYRANGDIDEYRIIELGINTIVCISQGDTKDIINTFVKA